MKLKMGLKKLELTEIKQFSQKLKMKDFDDNEGLWYPNTNFMTTFFAKDQVDILEINDEHQVLDINKNVTKNRLIYYKEPKNKTHILVLPKNMSQKFVVGSVIKLES